VSVHYTHTHARAHTYQHSYTYTCVRFHNTNAYMYIRLCTSTCIVLTIIVRSPLEKSLRLVSVAQVTKQCRIYACRIYACRIYAQSPSNVESMHNEPDVKSHRSDSWHDSFACATKRFHLYLFPFTWLLYWWRQLWWETNAVLWMQMQKTSCLCVVHVHAQDVLSLCCGCRCTRRLVHAHAPLARTNLRCVPSLLPPTCHYPTRVLADGLSPLES